MKRKIINKLYYVGYPLLRGIIYNVLGIVVEKLTRNSMHTSEITIDAPRAEVLKRLLDFENYPKYSSAVEELSVVERTAKSVRLKWKVNLEDALLQWEDMVTLPGSSSKVLFTSVSGDFDKYIRKIELRDEGSRTSLCTTTDIVFNLGLLNKVIGNIIKEKVVRINDNLLFKIKEIVERQR